MNSEVFRGVLSVTDAGGVHSCWIALETSL
jgi:hypothetical protein